MPRTEPSEATRALVTLALVGACGGGIAATRGTLAREHYRVHETTDVYLLPAPEQLIAMSLGHRAALADLLWSTVLVSQGIHMQEKRHYANVVHYLDAINALDPKFRAPYNLADTLITFQIGQPSHDEVLHARAVLERGTRELPLDADLWLNAGSFIAFIAPGTYLKDEAERAEWKRAGIGYLARASELAGDNAGITLQSLGAGAMLSRAGERDAAINFYTRACATTDNPDVKHQCEAHLAALLGEEQATRYREQERAFHDLWVGDVDFVEKTEFLQLGPPRDAARCAGPGHDVDPACAGTWKEWVDRREAAAAPAGPGPR